MELNCLVPLLKLGGPPADLTDTTDSPSNLKGTLAPTESGPHFSPFPNNRHAPPTCRSGFKKQTKMCAWRMWVNTVFSQSVLKSVSLKEISSCYIFDCTLLVICSLSLHTGPRNYCCFMIVPSTNSRSNFTFVQRASASVSLPISFKPVIAWQRDQTSRAWM